MPKQRILVLYDGKPGHLTQSYGIARLLASRLQDCDIEVQSSRPQFKLLNRSLRWLSSRRSRLAQQLVIALYSGISIKRPAPDLVVSFGGNVVALNVALHQYWHIPNLLLGNKYSIPSHLVDVHATALGAEQTANSVATKIALCNINRQACLQVGHELRQRVKGHPLWSLFIGGDGSGYQYAEADWHALGAALKNVSSRLGVRWLVSTSRRTDPCGTEVVRRYLDSSNCESVIWYVDKNSPSLEAYLGAADRIFCTEDSLSMLSEAVAMAKPVVSLQPATCEPRFTHSAMVEHMVTTGLLERIQIQALSNYEPGEFAPSISYDAHLEHIARRIFDLGVLGSNHQSVWINTPVVAQQVVLAS